MLKVIVIVILALGLLVALLGFALAGASMGIKAQTLPDARAWQEAHYDLSWYDPLAKEDYTVASYDGYTLHAQSIANPQPTDRYILISHGYTDNRFGALKYAKIYLDLGFNVLVYDLRGHGLNTPTFCTYTARESRDLLAMIEDARQRFGAMSLFGIHGESLGAATSVAVLKYAPSIDFVVADCGFSEIESVILGGMRRMHVPAWLGRVASRCAKLRYGYSYADMRPIDSLAENTVPILFMHGAEDNFIFPFHSEHMAKATQGYSEVHMVAGAHHAASVLTAPEEYRDTVARFVERVQAR